MANNQDTETHSETSEFKSSREHRYSNIYDDKVDNPSIPGHEIQCAMSQETRGAEPTMASVMKMMLQMMEEEGGCCSRKEQNEISVVSKEKTPGKSHIELGRIDGIIVPFLLDSGADKTLVPENLIRKEYRITETICIKDINE